MKLSPVKVFGLALIAIALVVVVQRMHRATVVSQQLASIPLCDESRIADAIATHNPYKFELVADSRSALDGPKFAFAQIYEMWKWGHGRRSINRWYFRKSVPDRFTLYSKLSHQKIYVSGSEVDAQYLPVLHSAYLFEYGQSPFAVAIAPMLPEQETPERREPDDKHLIVKGFLPDQNVAAIGVLERINNELWLKPFAIKETTAPQPVILSKLSVTELTQYLKDSFRLGDAQAQKDSKDFSEYYTEEPVPIKL